MAGAEHLTGISSRENEASGNALQINGPVTGQVVNHFHFYARRTKKTQAGAPLIHMSTASINITKPVSNRSVCTVRTWTRTAFSSAPRNRNVELHSNSTGDHGPVRVMICPDVEANWISQRIVRRLCLTVRSRGSHEGLRGATFDKTPLKPTGEFLDFACSESASNNACRHRFYVTSHPRFDVLFGSEMLQSPRSAGPT